MNKENKKIIIIMSCLQMVVGTITIIVSILFCLGKLGDNIVVCVIPVLLCCILACVNMYLNIRRAKINNK